MALSDGSEDTIEVVRKLAHALAAAIGSYPQKVQHPCETWVRYATVREATYREHCDALSRAWTWLAENDEKEARSADQ